MSDKADRVEGKLNEGAGAVSGDKGLKEEGQAQDAKGKAKQGVDNLKGRSEEDPRSRLEADGGSRGLHITESKGHHGTRF